MKRIVKIYFLLVALMIATTSSAVTFHSNGIYYELENGKVAVTSSKGSKYSGNILIPRVVKYKNRTYKVTKIDRDAFKDCKYLNKITIPNTVITIGENAFSDCSGLTSITLPNSITEIGFCAFFYCTGLTSITIPNSVTKIDGGAFWGCSGLTSITIPNSVTEINNGAFMVCTGLTSINVGNRNRIYDSRDSCNAIIHTATNSLIAGCKNTIIPNSVTTIGYQAFTGCSGLTSISIPNSVTKIDCVAFSNCSGLTSITIPNSVTEIGNYAFENCSGLRSVIISNSVTKVGENAFKGCTNLSQYNYSDSKIFTVVEEKAKFPGGDAALMKWVAEKLQYPAMAMEEGVQGRVYIKFVVEKDGSIGRAHVAQSCHPDLDKEALRIVKYLPKFIPAKNNGVIVRSWFVLPITFKLNRNNI